MSELIPSYPLSEFKKLNSGQIRRLKSCELTSDGKYVCTFINPTTEFIRVQAEYHGQLSNTMGLETLEEILEVE